jgi:hypothetical protein
MILPRFSASASRISPPPCRAQYAGFDAAGKGAGPAHGGAAMATLSSRASKLGLRGGEMSSWSSWQKFYYAWGIAAGALALTILVVLIVPIAIPYAAAILVPVLAVAAVYGVFFVRCPKCGVRLTETVLSHGLPQESCPICLYDLKTQETKPAGR